MSNYNFPVTCGIDSYSIVQNASYNFQLAFMDNFNHEFSIRTKYMENRNEIYDYQSLQNAIGELGQFSMVPFPFPYQNITIDTVNWQSPFFITIIPTIHWVISETQLSEGIGLLSLLSTMYMTLRCKARVKVKDGWKENPSLYVLGISKSGTKKSALIERLRTPFEDYEQTQKKEISPEVKQIAQQELKRKQRQKIRDALKGSIDILDDLKQLSCEGQKLKKELKSDKLLASTITSTALLKILKDNNEAISILDSEPRLLSLLEKDPKLLDLFLSGHTGEAFSYDTAYDNYSFDRPCLNLCVMCQPDKAQTFLGNKKLADRGLLGRFVPIFSNQTWENPSVNNSQECTEFYENKIQSLLEYCSSKEEIITFSLSEEAQGFLLSLGNIPSQNVEPYDSFMAKGKGLIVRIATAIHLWDFKGNNDSFEISLSEIQDALTIVTTFVFPHAQFMYGRYNPTVYKTAYKILQHLNKISGSERCKINDMGISVSVIKKALHTKGTELDASLELLSIYNFIRVLRTQDGADKVIVHPMFYLEFPNLAQQFPKLD